MPDLYSKDEVLATQPRPAERQPERFILPGSSDGDDAMKAKAGI